MRQLAERGVGLGTERKMVNKFIRAGGNVRFWGLSQRPGIGLTASLWSGKINLHGWRTMKNSGSENKTPPELSGALAATMYWPGNTNARGIDSMKNAAWTKM
jgi:hypothetical protein